MVARLVLGENAPGAADGRRASPGPPGRTMPAALTRFRFAATAACRRRQAAPAPRWTGLGYQRVWDGSRYSGPLKTSYLRPLPSEGNAPLDHRIGPPLLSPRSWKSAPKASNDGGTATRSPLYAWYARYSTLLDHALLTQHRQAFGGQSQALQHFVGMLSIYWRGLAYGRWRQ